MVISRAIEITKDAVRSLPEYDLVNKRIKDRASIGYNYVLLELNELDPRIKVYLEASGYTISEIVTTPPASSSDRYKINWSLKGD